MSDPGMSGSGPEVLDFLRSHGALRPGHTQFRNGLVSDGWIEKGEVFRDPAALDVLASVQARAIAGAFPNLTLLVGAPACGAVLASAVARHLGRPVAFVLLGNALQGDRPQWHRMHVPALGEQAVYVDDLICTGQDARAALAFMRGAGLTVLGVSAWISRTELPGETLITLAEPPFRTFPAAEHPFPEPVQFHDIRE